MKTRKIAIVLGSYHRDQVGQMLDAVRRDAETRNVQILREVWVPGSMEKPLAAKRLLADNAVQGLVVLGIIERGETKHGLVMGHTVIGALVDLQLHFMKPIGIGILGPEIEPPQIPPRLIPYALSALSAVCEMIE